MQKPVASENTTPAPIDRRQRSLDRALLVAARKGDLGVVQSSLEEGASPAAVNPSGHTALMLAARNQRLAVVEDLARVSDGKAQNNRGETALILACGHGDPERFGLMARRLLAISDASAADADGNTALLTAAGAGSASAINVLLHASSAKKANNDGDTALMLFSANAFLSPGWKAAFDDLLAKSDASARNKKGETALHAAAKQGVAGIVEALLAVCDPNAQDSKGFTPLMAALDALCGWEDEFGGMEMIFRASDLSLEDSQGLTALDRAAAAGRWSCVNWLGERASLDQLQEAARKAATDPGANGCIPRVHERIAELEAQSLRTEIQAARPKGESGAAFPPSLPPQARKPARSL